MESSNQIDSSAEAQKASLNSNEQTSVEGAASSASWQKRLQSFQEELQSLGSVEDKVRMTLSVMKEALSQEGQADFRLFWEAKNSCIVLFKEKLPAALRTALWQEYRELADEGKRLKEVVDQHAAFAAEQIQLAIDGVEKRLVALEAGQSKFDLDLELPCDFLKDKLQPYIQQQGLLQGYNAFAQRINELRAELIATEMKGRLKNQLFKQLSALGDKVFPRRKQLIKDVSARFREDTALFIDAGFGETGLKQPFYVLREEIKGLQGFARRLTLDPKTFAEMRKDLSECWDRVREAERERKKQRAQKKEEFQKNLDETLSEFRAVQTALEKGEASIEQALSQLDSIFHSKAKELGYEEKKILRQEKHEVAKPLVAKQEKEREERVEKERAQEEQRQKQAQACKDKLQQLIADTALPPQQLEEEKEELEKEVAKLKLDKFSRREMEKLLRDLGDSIAERLEQRAIEQAGKGDIQAAKELKQVLQQKEQRRKEIKAELEKYRKLAGSSGLDFSQAMTYQELVSSEKSKLEAVDQSITELKQQLESLKQSSS